jgi:hypothetical protein
VYAINTRSVSRYRERHCVSGAKSDAGDAWLLADLVRTDAARHRPVAGDSPAAEGIKVLALACQRLIWDRHRGVLRLRSMLREYFPAALAAFADLSAQDTLELLARAPEPQAAARLSKAQITAALKRPVAATSRTKPPRSRLRCALRSLPSHRNCAPLTALR